jgi:hypothetical protein
VEMTDGGRRWKTLVARYGSSKHDVGFPTAAPRPWKSPTARFPHFHSAGHGLIHFNFNQENQPQPMPFGLWLEKSRKEIPVVSRRPPVQDHLVLESNVDFSIILRLENARRPGRRAGQTVGQL